MTVSNRAERLTLSVHTRGSSARLFTIISSEDIRAEAKAKGIKLDWLE